MNRRTIFAVVLALVATVTAQRLEVQDALTNIMPGGADSNSPGFWYDGQFRILNSTGMPRLSSGLNQFLFRETGETETNPPEAVWMDPDGTLYAWYHHEPPGVCPGVSFTAPEIGALVLTAA